MESLSGGQRQRAWIAMTLAQKTDTILLDEPTTIKGEPQRIVTLYQGATDTPIMPGSAKAFLEMDCKITPDIAIPAPINKAKTIRGKRKSTKITQF